MDEKYLAQISSMEARHNKQLRENADHLRNKEAQWLKEMQDLQATMARRE